MSAEFRSVTEVAELLAVDRKTVYREIGRGRLRAVKLGRAIRVPRGAIDELRVEAGPRAEPGVTPAASSGTGVTFRSRTRTVAGTVPGGEP